MPLGIRSAETSDKVSTPPPGWYSATETSSSVRWWDGQQWTDHFKPIETSGSASGFVVNPPAPLKNSPRVVEQSSIYQEPWNKLRRSDGAEEPRSQESNAPAVTGFGLGIASFFLFSVPILGSLLSLAALTTSGVGLSKTSSETAVKYRVFSIIGLALGGIYLVLSFAAPYNWA